MLRHPERWRVEHYPSATSTTVMIFSRYLQEEVADDERKERRGNKLKRREKSWEELRVQWWGTVNWTPPTEDMPSLAE